MVTSLQPARAMASVVAACALIVPFAVGASAQPPREATSESSISPAAASASATTAQNGRIAFSTGFILVQPDVGGNSQVFTVNPDGSAVRQLTHVPSDRDAGDPAWSSSGARIAYVSNLSGRFGVWVMHADGSGQHQVAYQPGFDYFTPRWSPTGRHLVVTQCKVKSGFLIWCHIVVMRPDGSGARTVVGGRRINQNPDYSPTGRRIAFESDRAGFHSAIYVVHSDGSAPKRLTKPILEAFWPRWSPDGRHLLFTSHCCTSRSRVYVMRADGSHVKKLTHVPSRRAVDLAFASYSPDGRRIVLISGLMRRGDHGFNDLYTMRADGSQLRRIVADHPHVALSDWGPAR